MMNLPKKKMLMDLITVFIVLIVVGAICLTIRHLNTPAEMASVPTPIPGLTDTVKFHGVEEFIQQETEKLNPEPTPKVVKVVTKSEDEKVEEVQSTPTPKPTQTPTLATKSTQTSVSTPEPTSLPAITPEPTQTPSLPDRTKPLYDVYKGGYCVNVDTNLQWYIRDMCNSYQFYEKYVYGMILCESTFQPNVSNGGCYGLCQISSFWIHGANIEHFTDDYESRNLYDPYDNLLTLTEMWCYARDTYHLDLTTREGMIKVLYWHATGKDPTYVSSFWYFDIVEKYANELVPLQ